jgi:hypothetical protein
MDDSPNPYAAPRTVDSLSANGITGGEDESEAARIRKELLKHEVSLKSIAWLYYLSCIGCVLAGLATVAGFASVPEGDAEGMGEVIGVIAIFLGVGVISFLGATWLGKLDRRAKIPVGILSGLGLLNVPVGTAINAYILYLVFSQKGKRVLSDEYKQIIRQTPEIKYTSPLWLKIAAGLLLLIAAIVIGFALTG